MDDTLSTWRTERTTWLSSLGDPLSPTFDEAILSRAKTMDSPSRISELEKYRRVKAEEPGGGTPRSIAENKWCLTLITADRADAVKSSRSDKATAKKVDDGKPALTLASLLGGVVK